MVVPSSAVFSANGNQQSLCFCFDNGKAKRIEVQMVKDLMTGRNVSEFIKEGSVLINFRSCRSS
jgi:hypothetical protein